MTEAASRLPLYPRFAQSLVEDTLTDTPITVIQGARQVGKSTLARAVVSNRVATLLNLDDGPAYRAALADPDAFVRQAPGLLVIDEVQRVPSLILAMKGAVDEDRRPGRFLITGSANLLEPRHRGEPRWTRRDSHPVRPESRRDRRQSREDFVDRLLAGDAATLQARESHLTRDDYLDILCAGSYPEPMGRAGRRRGAWFDNYISRIIGRDARDVSRLQHLDRLPDLLRLLAANNAGELVKRRIGLDAGIPETTLQPYLNLLQTLYLVHELPSWGNNLTSRVVGRPKVSLLDTGLAARLNHLTPAALRPGMVPEVAGGLFEAFVAGDSAVSWSGPRRTRSCSTSATEIGSRSTSSSRQPIGV